MGKNKLNKSILLGTLVFGQCAGTVMVMQNSIVQVYAEQKNKEVTSQEFLDYINQLKEQNPDFKFSQGETKVFDSEAQALANLAEQKQAINTAISNYKHAVEERNTRYEQVKEKTLSTNYTLTDGVIDCPIEVKKELLDRIDNGVVYLSVGFGNHHLYYYSETGYIEKGHSEKGYFGYLPNAFDKEYDYFKDQLTAYKMYKISDIIMDKALRDTSIVQE